MIAEAHDQHRLTRQFLRHLRDEIAGEYLPEAVETTIGTYCVSDYSEEWDLGAAPFEGPGAFLADLRKQEGLAARAMELLILTATLRNRAAWALSYPYLELTLTDAQDRVVVRRALAPADYASGTADLQRGIVPNGEVTLKVFIDASATAQAGYRLYMFYP
jgi:hypothetical protein